MYTRIYLDKIKEFLSTTSFSVIVGIISFLIWFSSEPFNYIFMAVYFLFSFIPLLSDDGKNYIPLFLFLLITSNKNLSFVDLNIQTWLLFSVMILSFIIFIIKNRLTFKKGDLFIPMTALILTIFVSYLYNAIKSSILLYQGALFLVFLTTALLTYALFCTILGNRECITFFSKNFALLSVFIILQLMFAYIRKGEYTFSNDNISLGWAFNKDMISTFLISSIPFILLLINRKKILYFVPLLLNLIALIVLGNNLSLLFVFFAFIPITIMAFKNFGKLYPYLSILSISSFIIVFSLLLFLNDIFNKRMIESLSILLFFSDKSPVLKFYFDDAFSVIKTQYILGGSIKHYILSGNYLLFSSNTYLSTLVLGGIVSLIAYLYLEIRVLYHTLRKKVEERMIFFFFLISFFFVGLFTNTIYSIPILFLYLLSNSVYQMSNREDDIKIHKDYPQKRTTII